MGQYCMGVPPVSVIAPAQTKLWVLGLPLVQYNVTNILKVPILIGFGENEILVTHRGIGLWTCSYLSWVLSCTGAIRGVVNILGGGGRGVPDNQ